MALWQDFHSHLFVSAIGCPIPLADQELRNAAIEFLSRTRAWCVWLDPVTTRDSVREYDFDLPANADIVRVEQATVAGNPVTVAPYRASKTNPRSIATGTNEGVTVDTRTFILSSSYSAGQSLEIQASLCPSRQATGIEDFLFDMFYLDILDGAKARILKLKGTPFFAPDIAMDSQAAFEEAIVNKKLDDWRGNTAARRRVVASNF